MGVLLNYLFAVSFMIMLDLLLEFIYYCCIIVITAILLSFKFVLIRQEHDRCRVVYFDYHFLFRSFSFLQVLLSSSTCIIFVEYSSLM